MANVLAVSFAVVGIVIMLTSLLVWTAIMLPRPVTRAQNHLETNPGQCFFAGLAVLCMAGGTFFLALSFRKLLTAQVEALLKPLSEFAGVTRYAGDAGTLAHNLLYITLIPFFMALLIGGAAFARLFAQRADAAGTRPVASLVGGAFTLSAALFLPLVGWFAFLPIVGAMSAGAGMMSLLARKRGPQS